MLSYVRDSDIFVISESSYPRNHSGYEDPRQKVFQVPEGQNTPRDKMIDRSFKTDYG